jgi:serine/threonine-protein kinase
MPEPSTVAADGVARDESALARVVCEAADLLKAGEATALRRLIESHPEHGEELHKLLLAIARLDGLPTPEALPPQRIDGYELMERLGGGGQAEVYKARHEGLKRLVALKMIRLDRDSADQRHRLLREAEILAGVKHPNVVAVYSFGEQTGRIYFTMELLGASLKDRLADYALPAAPSRTAEGRAAIRQRQERVAGLLEKVARAVQHLHDRGVIHRDLKPANILLDDKGEPLVADLGIARRTDPEYTRTEGDAVCGTRNYMAPEQAEGRPDLTRAVDVYALGVILYQLLTGTVPVRDGEGRDGAPEPPSARNRNVGSDSELELICLKCLQRDPAERYSSAQALADDLGRFVKGEPISLRGFSFLRHALASLDRRRSGPFDHWAAIELADAGLSLVAGVAGFALIRADAHLAWLWLLLMGYLAGVWLVMFVCLRRARPLHALEWELVRLWMGHALGVVVLVWLLCPPFGGARAADALRVFPLALLLTGMIFLVEGRIYWGRLYLLGLAYFAVAALTPLWWEGAPLVFGTFTAASLAWLAGQKRGGAVRP